MRKPRTGWVVLLGIFVMFAIPPATRAQEKAAGPPPATAAEPSANLSQRVGDLEKEIEHLQSELAMVKKQLGESSAPAAANAATAAPSSTAQAAASTPALAPAAETPAPTAPAPVATSLASLLGPMNVTGFVDGYYGYNFDHPHAAACPSGTVPSGFATPCSGFRAFDGPSQQLALNMIELILDKPPEANNSRLGYHLAFGFGNAMNVVNATDPGGLAFAQYVKEGYLSYLAPVGKGLQFDFGKFVTPNGAEVIETKDNWNYSRGLLFTYAIPFYHFGLRSKYTFNDKFSLTGYLVNGWNNIIDNNTGKTYGVSFGWNPNKKVSITQNYMIGPEQLNDNRDKRQLIDTVVAYSPTTRLSLIWNYDYGRGDRMPTVVNPVFWTGVAGYVRYAFNDRYAVATRYEYFDDHNGFTTGTAQHFNEFTSTFERKINGSLITRLEFRRDMADQPSFFKGTVPVRSQNTALAGVVYTFDVKELK
jgi:hypothetical protein